LAQAKKSSIDGYTIEMARTHTLTVYTQQKKGERRRRRSRHFLGGGGFRIDGWREAKGRAGREKGHNELALHEDKVENR
jgi:hypothetical protein